MRWQGGEAYYDRGGGQHIEKQKRSAANVVGGAFEKTHSCAGRAFATRGEWSGNGGEERSVNTVS